MKIINVILVGFYVLLTNIDSQCYTLIIILWSGIATGLEMMVSPSSKPILRIWVAMMSDNGCFANIWDCSDIRKIIRVNCKNRELSLIVFGWSYRVLFTELRFGRVSTPSSSDKSSHIIVIWQIPRVSVFLWIDASGLPGLLFSTRYPHWTIGKIEDWLDRAFWFQTSRSLVSDTWLANTHNQYCRSFWA